MQYYYTTSICKYEPRQSFSARETIDSDQYGVFFFEVPSDTFICDLSVHQLNKRFYYQEGFEYAPMRMILGRWDQDDLVFIDGEYKMEQSVFLEIGAL